MISYYSEQFKDSDTQVFKVAIEPLELGWSKASSLFVLYAIYFVS